MESDFRSLCDDLLKRLESERASVAGLLRDELIPLLTTARYLIEAVEQRIRRGELADTAEALQQASARIRETSEQLATMSVDLRPRVLDDLGLLPALSWHLRGFAGQNRGIFALPRLAVNEAQVPADLKLPIFRIVEAALSNVARHSKASSVKVSLSMAEDELRLAIEDNGVGFSMERWRTGRNGHGGCGLGLIQRWAETTGGRFSVEAAPRHGTRVQTLWRRLHLAAPGDGQRPSSDSGLSSARPVL